MVDLSLKLDFVLAALGRRHHLDASQRVPFSLVIEGIQNQGAEQGKTIEAKDGDFPPDREAPKPGESPPVEETLASMAAIFASTFTPSIQEASASPKEISPKEISIGQPAVVEERIPVGRTGRMPPEVLLEQAGVFRMPREGVGRGDRAEASPKTDISPKGVSPKEVSLRQHAGVEGGSVHVSASDAQDKEDGDSLTLEQGDHQDRAPQRISAPDALPESVRVKEMKMDPMPWQGRFSFRAHEIGQRVLWMVRHDAYEAHIQLHPPELGRLDVRVSVNHDHVSLAFNVHQTLRETLEEALPRLRMMLAQGGLTLVDVDISDHSQENAPGQGFPGNASGEFVPAKSTQAVRESPSSPPSFRGTSLIDAYV